MVAESLLTNGLGRACRQLTVSRDTDVNVALQEVLVHYSIVLRCAEESPIIRPFWQIFHQTNQMQVNPGHVKLC